MNGRAFTLLSGGLNKGQDHHFQTRQAFRIGKQRGLFVRFQQAEQLRQIGGNLQLGAPDGKAGRNPRLPGHGLQLDELPVQVTQLRIARELRNRLVLGEIARQHIANGAAPKC